MIAKPKIEVGYPLEEYTFTGEWSTQKSGFYKAERNKVSVKYPVYQNKDGKKIIDATQLIKIKPKRKR